MRVLVVDDSKLMRAVIARILKGLGFEVLEAADGRRALAQLERAGRVELCLVDWNMPVMNGIEFIETVRARHAWDAMKLMMITVASDPQQVRRALDAGADEFLVKPVNREMVVAKLALIGIGGD